jgi:hypothetical protein
MPEHNDERRLIGLRRAMACIGYRRHGSRRPTRSRWSVPSHTNFTLGPQKGRQNVRKIRPVIPVSPSKERYLMASKIPSSIDGPGLAPAGPDGRQMRLVVPR